MKKYKYLLSIIAVTFCLQSYAVVKPNNLFSDNMVLQRDKPIKIWGIAEPNERVEVKFINQNKKTKADSNGNWTIMLDAQPHGGPYIMTVKGKSNTIDFNNILMGDVWLCSGQSNMEFTVKNSKDATIEISRANYPNIRSFNVKQAIGTEPKSEVDGIWQVCTPTTVDDFSAVGYYFARELNTDLNIPIGIINSSWGGTDIETWISEDVFTEMPQKFKQRYDGIEKIDNIDQFLEENKVKKAAFYSAMDNDLGISEQWYDKVISTSNWKTMEIPQLWENSLGELDGILWFRYNIDLPKEDAGKTAVIQLGPIDDDDITWINGVKIGATKGYNENRIYSIPENVLTEGANSIVVKVIDYYGGGGMYGNSSDMYLEVNSKKYPIAGQWLYRESVTNKEYNFVEPSPNMQPSLLYNGMINPITELPIAGVIWYQGENNAWNAYDYRTLFPTMIKNWREKWNDELPFYWVQLANYLAKDSIPVESAWAELRMAQTETLKLPYTGQATIIDIGEANDIHPRNKQDVGKRLALIALNKYYGKTDIVYSGPVLKSVNIEGSRVILTFDNIGKGLYTPNKYGYVEGFIIAGSDKQFEWARGYIEENKIILSSPNVKEPIVVRYAWGNNPDINLFNSSGLPLSPFKTDDWKWSTDRD